MKFVSCGHVHESANRHRMSARDSDASQLLATETAKQRERGPTQGLDLLQQRLERAGIRIRRAGPHVLVEAGQRSLVGARERQSPISEYPFGIDEMADDLANRPLARRVAISRFALTQSREKPQRFCVLRLER